MAWKIYFFILALLYAINVAATIWYPQIMGLDAIDYIDFCFAILALVGVFGYAFKKAVLNQKVWKIYLLFIVFWDISFTALRSEWIGGEDLMYEIMALVIIVLVLIPQYVAIFRYGFRSKQLWEPYKNV